MNMNDAKEKTPQIIVVGGASKRPAVQIVASPSKMPKWISLADREPKKTSGNTSGR